MQVKSVLGRQSTADVLKKLKSQEPTPVAKPEVPWTRGNKPEFIKEEKKIVLKEIDQAGINAEKVLRKIEDLEKRAKHGENYLNYYSEIKYLEDQFLRAVDGVTDTGNTANSRLVLRRDAILRKRSFQK